MMNIAIHGLDKMKAEQTRKIINVLLKGLSLDVVVTTFDAQTVAKDLNGMSRPHLYCAVTDGNKEASEAIKMLQMVLNADILISQANTFLPRPRPHDPSFKQDSSQSS